VTDENYFINFRVPNQFGRNPGFDISGEDIEPRFACPSTMMIDWKPTCVAQFGLGSQFLD
jgi:hypothetical protein